MNIPPLENSSPVIPPLTLMVSLLIFFDWVPTSLKRNILLISPKDRLPNTLIHGILGIIFFLGQFYHIFVLQILCALWYSILLATVITNWWIPYLLNRHPGTISPDVFRELYSKNLTILPNIRNHPIVPGLQHILIHVSILLTVIESWKVVL